MSRQFVGQGVMQFRQPRFVNCRSSILLFIVYLHIYVISFLSFKRDKKLNTPQYLVFEPDVTVKFFDFLLNVAFLYCEELTCTSFSFYGHVLFYRVEDGIIFREFLSFL